MRLWALAAAVLATALLCLGFVLATTPGGSDIPTMVVERGGFRHRITAEGNLEAAESTVLAAPVTGSRRQKIAWIIADGSRVEAGDPVIRFDPTDSERERDAGLADRQKVDHRLEKARLERQTQIDNLDRDADLAQAEADNAHQFQSRDSAIYSRNEILESSIDTELADHRAEYAEQSKGVRTELAGADIELLEIQRRKAELKVEEADRGLSELEVTAPHAGIVVLDRDWRGNVARVGETAWPGRTLATIPDLSAMEAAVYVLEADAGGLAAGQSATVVVEARPDTPIPATVASVDPVAQRRVGWVPVQYFRAVLSLEARDLTLLKPGHRVQAEILVAHHEQALAIPRQAVHRRDDANIVYRLEDGEFREVAVELGAAALGRVVIESGLEDGDVIALRHPDRAPGQGPEEESDNGNGSAGVAP